MKKTKSHAVLLAGIAVALSAVLLVMIYGEGLYYQGYLKYRPLIKVRRVAQVTCRSDANQEGNFCAYTLEPLQYFVMKQGSGFIIYGPKPSTPPVTGQALSEPISKILADNNIDLTEGASYTGSTYSLSHVPNWTDIKVGFAYTDAEGVKRPAFTIDAATAAAMQDVKSVEVQLPRSVKIRFNDFYMPK